MAKATKATVQVKKKRWVTIIAPKLFNEMPLGESYLLEPKDAIGRTVRVSVMQITGEPQKQYISAGFQIVDVQGEKLLTAIKYYKILPSALRRLVRRNKDKFEDSMIVTCADGKLMRIKPYVVARYKTKGSILTGLRKVTREAVVRYAVTVTAEQLYADVITSKLQRAVHDAIRKTFPIGACEIKTLELLKGEGKKPVLPPVPEPKAEQKEDAAAETEESGADPKSVDDSDEPVDGADESAEDVAAEDAEEVGKEDPSEADV
jgi:small subunit ribosomal protein S3Ae